MLACKETEKMVKPYIDGGLDEKELEEFMIHVSGCQSCREELEIYFTVTLGLKQLEHGTGTYDIQRTLAEHMELSWLKIKTVKLRKVIMYAVNTLFAIWLFIIIILQLRLWIQTGIF